MTHTNRIDIKLMQPFDFMKFKDPTDPQYFNISCWRWLQQYDGDRIFPTIKPGDIYEGFAIGDLGRDYDGSELGIVVAGPNKGSTILIMPPRNATGQFCPPKIN